MGKVKVKNHEGAKMVDETLLTDEVWNQEVAYWKYLKAADLDSYLSLWHEDVVGWPNNQAVPMEKEGIHQLMSGIVASLQLESSTFDLIPKAVRIIEGVGIVHYEVHAKALTKAGSELVVQERLTHTWLKTENGWKIIGGMSAPLTNSETN